MWQRKCHRVIESCLVFLNRLLLDRLYCGFRCLIKDFEKRPYAAELLNHPFVSWVPQKRNEVSKAGLFRSFAHAQWLLKES